MLELDIKIAQPSDLSVVIALMLELIDELCPDDEDTRFLKNQMPVDMQRCLSCEDSRIFLVKLRNKSETIGLARADILYHAPTFRMRQERRCGYVDQMYVRAAYRRMGVGRTMLQLCEDWFSSKNLQYVLLHAADKATHFYLREGYEKNHEMIKLLKK